MFYEQKLYVQDDGVISHVTIIKLLYLASILLISKAKSAKLLHMSYATNGCVLLDDVTSHVTILSFFILLVSCLFRRQKVPNYSNMSHETQRCMSQVT